MNDKYRTKKYTALVLSLILLCTGLTLTGCGRKQELTKSGFYFNTVITITFYDSEDSSLMDGCFALADHYEKLFSNTVKGSDIYNINTHATEPVTVDPETITLLQKGLEYAKVSDGKFDITIGKLSSLWDFGNNEGTIPDDADIKSALATVDYHAISIDGDTVTLTNPDAMIDLGGIAKGYIADQMKAYLNENGVTSGMINLGGNVLTIGSKSSGDAYTIGIQKPFAEDGTAIAAVKISDASVVSSGVYERCFYVDDTLYHHILDTDTGYPYDNGLLGVTIICKNSVDGDGLSTTCFSLGLTDGMKLIESLDDTEAIFITDDYKLHFSSGMGDTIPYTQMD